MAAPATNTSSHNALAGLGTGGTGTVGGRLAWNALESNAPSSTAHLVDFHCVLIMKPGAARDAVSTALWDAGMLVTTFQSLHEAEGLLVGGAVHAVLLDGAQGVALATQLTWWLNAVGRGAVKVVLFGRLGTDQTTAALKGGVSHCLPFPEHPATFARLLGTTVGFDPHGWRNP